MGLKSINERLEQLAKESEKRVVVATQNKDEVITPPTEKSNELMPAVKHDSQLDIFQPDVVRPELNIGRWANFIFTSPHNPNVYKTRERTFPVELKDDFGKVTDEVLGSVKVEPIQGNRTPTTTTYEVFLAICHLWEEQGKPLDGWVHFSSRQIANVLGKKWSGQLAKRIDDELAVLKGSLMTWRWSFTDNDRAKVEYVDSMNFLSSKQYVNTAYRRKSQKFDVLHKVEINSLILANMVAGQTKPINFKTYLAIEDSGAKVLYSFLDVILANKTVWERRLEGLLTDLDIQADRYKTKFARKALVAKWIKTLNGLDLFHGKLTLELKETADKKDWKIVARRTPRIVKNRTPKKLANSKDVVAILVEDITAAAGQGDTHQNLYKMFAKFYPAEMIYQAISEMKADTSPNSKGKMLTAIMHRLAHSKGFDWIKPCSTECKYRPENSLFS